MSVSMAALGLELGVRTKRARTSAHDALCTLKHEVGEVQRNASQAARALKSAVERDGGARALRYALDEQERDLSAFARELEELVEEQVRLVQELSHGCVKIEQVRGDMEQLAHEANLLAVNTAVSASRLGERGATVASVAGHMQSLSVEVAQTSEDLAARVSVMRTQIPELQDSSAELQGLAKGLKEELRDTQKEFSQHTQRIADHVAHALEQTQERLVELRANGDSAQLHLGRMKGLDDRLERMEGLGVQALFVGGGQELLSALGGSGAAAEAAEDEAPEAGELLLF